MIFDSLDDYEKAFGRKEREDLEIKMAKEKKCFWCGWYRLVDHFEDYLLAGRQVEFCTYCSAVIQGATKIKVAKG